MSDEGGSKGIRVCVCGRGGGGGRRAVESVFERVMSDEGVGGGVERVYEGYKGCMRV